VAAEVGNCVRLRGGAAALHDCWWAMKALLNVGKFLLVIGLLYAVMCGVMAL
jgi:hypothetical protein